MANGEIEGSPNKIQTFVFLDLETLGFDEHKPRILEIAMIAVSRENLLSMKCQAYKNNPHYNKGDPLPLPRVCHKYSTLYYPRKFIHPTIEEITGLSNYNLEHLKGFNKDSATAIKLFLDLPSPVAFVAHNGHGFDFPILKAELLGVDGESLEGVVCIDSLQFSRDFEKVDIEKITEIAKEFLNEDCTNNNFCNTSSNSHVIENGLSHVIENGHSPSKLEETEAIPSCSTDTTFNIHPQDNFQTPKKKLKLDSSKKMEDFQTPPRIKIEDSKNSPPPPRGKKGLPPPVNTPSPKKHLSENANVHNGNGSRVRKALFLNKPLPFPEIKKKPFRQPHIYYRIYGQKYLAHRAEFDAEALLRICAYHGEDFVSWADSNCSPFRSVIPKWKTRKTFLIK
ncbi:Three prime repair exonuclease 2 [Armadillidium nasatum]|uniref:Three prime repair exonuclease 2 n=1 Tax=Armadillidium nasatum TaxID=96803 RepID=A0A5N5T5P2_9CRUS|nr:Three prime repair exonuclease 2 [Armadillidium nasatum]